MNRTGKYTVVRACTDHGAVTLREHPRNGTLHVVEYDDDDVEAEVSSLETGSVVEMELRRAGRRGNAWCAESAQAVDAV